MSDYLIIPFNDAPMVPFNFDGRKLFSSASYEMVHLTLQPGEGMEQHVQPMDVVFFVLEGIGSLVIGHELYEISVNTTIHVHAGVLRSWKNTGDGPLRILVNKLIA